MKRLRRNLFRCITIGSCLFFLFGLSTKAQLLTLYGVISNEIVTINTTTGLATSIGTFNNALTPLSNLSYHDGVGTLFGAANSTSNVSLVSINTTNGQATVVAPLTLAPFGTQIRLLEGLAYNPSDGLLYGAVDTFPVPTSYHSHILVTINPATGVATRITDITGTCNVEADALGWANGRLFSIDGCPNPNNFYRVNQVNGVSSFVGTTFVLGIGDMSYNHINGLMYAYNSNRQLMTIDTNTASVGAIGNTHTAADFGGNFLRGIAFVPTVVLFEGMQNFRAWPEKGANQLAWEITGGEYYRFLVERSFDGIDFRRIGDREDQSGGNFEFSDRDWIALGQEEVFYRIKALHPDGAESHSQVVEVRRSLEDAPGMRLWPNPITSGSRLNIDFARPFSEMIVVEVYSLLGEKVDSFTQTPDQKLDQISLELPMLSPGCYLVKVNSSGQTQVARVMIR